MHKTKSLNLLTCMQHVKSMFCSQTYTLKVWAGRVSSNNFMRQKKFPTLFCSIEQPTLCFSFVSPLRASYWRNNVGNTRPPANKPETFPKAKWRKECFGILPLSCACDVNLFSRTFTCQKFAVMYFFVFWKKLSNKQTVSFGARRNPTLIWRLWIWYAFIHVYT